VSTFYVISEVENLRRFLDSKDPLPFTNDIHKYRIYENIVFDKLSTDISNQRPDNNKSSLITFLTIVNPSDVTAYATVAEAEGLANATLGDLEGHTAILIPITYKPATNGHETRASEYHQLRYEARIANTVQNFTREIPKETNPAWTPSLGNIRGWARAAPEEEDHLQNLRPNLSK